jgi:hypothetical protein
VAQEASPRNVTVVVSRSKWWYLLSLRWRASALAEFALEADDAVNEL